jgi:hypothetical protein
MSAMTAATKATNTPSGKSSPPTETFRARKIQPPTTKLYAESFKGSNNLRRNQEKAQAIIQASSVRADPAPPDGGLTVTYFAATSTSLEAQASATSRLASAVPTLAQPPSSTASRCS